MKPTKPKLPSEAIQLYNDFIHGEISRCDFMESVQRLAGGLAAATVINALMPNYALGQQVSRSDERIKSTYETVPSRKGNGSIKGYSFGIPIDPGTRCGGSASNCSPDYYLCVCKTAVVRTLSGSLKLDCLLVSKT